MPRVPAFAGMTLFQVFFETVIVGNFDEKSFVRWAIFTATSRAMCL